MTAVRLLVDPPGGGAWNMAVDEVLLHTAAEHGLATLRFYQWNEPTLSLGYFQAASDREKHAASRDCPLVRRASGGGAIVHDRELTYSLALPVKDRFAAPAGKVNDMMHDTLISTLASLGVAARRHGWVPAKLASGKPVEPFLCFQRRSPGDVLCGDSKIAGSAQRRHRRALLQHGSVLLDESAGAPELPGIHQIAGVILHPKELSRRWQEQVRSAGGFALAKGTLNDSEFRDASRLCAERFGNRAWTFRRADEPPLS